MKSPTPPPSATADELRDALLQARAAARVADARLSSTASALQSERAAHRDSVAAAEKLTEELAASQRALEEAESTIGHLRASLGLRRSAYPRVRATAADDLVKYRSAYQPLIPDGPLGHVQDSAACAPRIAEQQSSDNHTNSSSSRSSSSRSRADGPATVDAQADRILELESRVERLQRERDAAVEDKAVAVAMAKAAMAQANAAAEMAGELQAALDDERSQSSKAGRGALLSAKSLSTFAFLSADLASDVSSDDAAGDTSVDADADAGADADASVNMSSTSAKPAMVGSPARVSASLLSDALNNRDMTPEEVARFRVSRNARLRRHNRHSTSRSRYLSSVSRPGASPTLLSPSDKGAAAAAIARARAGRTGDSGSDDDLLFGSEHPGRSERSGHSASDDGGSASSGDSLLSDLVHEVNLEMESQFAMEARHSAVVAELTAASRAAAADYDERCRILQAEVNRLMALVTALELEKPVFGVVSINGGSDVPFTLSETYQSTFLIQFNAPPGPVSLLVTNNAQRSHLELADPLGSSPDLLASHPHLQSSMQSAAMQSSMGSSAGFLSVPGSPQRSGMSHYASAVSDVSLMSGVSDFSAVSSVSRYSTHAHTHGRSSAAASVASELDERTADAHAAAVHDAVVAHKPVLGLVITPTDSLKIGVQVASTTPDGPAAAAGIVPNDVIITLAGYDTNSPAHFGAVVRKLAVPHASLPVRFIRAADGAVIRASLAVASAPRAAHELPSRPNDPPSGLSPSRSLVAINHISDRDRESILQEDRERGLDVHTASMSLLAEQGLV